MLVAGCGAQRPALEIVESQEYGARRCWFEGVEFTAFLVMAEEDGRAVPYAVSAKCLVTGNSHSDGMAVLDHLNTIRLVDRSGTLQRAFPRVRILDSLRSHPPQPSSRSRMYYIRAHVTDLKDHSYVVYAPQEVIELKDLNLEFEPFLDLSRQERAGILAAVSTAE
jgi:hypothetical protein